MNESELIYGGITRTIDFDDSSMTMIVMILDSALINNGKILGVVDLFKKLYTYIVPKKS